MKLMCYNLTEYNRSLLMSFISTKEEKENSFQLLDRNLDKEHATTTEWVLEKRYLSE